MNSQGSERIRFAIAALAVSNTFLAAPASVLAQQAEKVYRVGLLNAIPRSDSNLAAFLNRLRELGYVEGKSIRVQQPASDTIEAHRRARLSACGHRELSDGQAGRGC